MQHGLPTLKQYIRDRKHAGPEDRLAYKVSKAVFFTTACLTKTGLLPRAGEEEQVLATLQVKDDPYGQMFVAVLVTFLPVILFASAVSAGTKLANGKGKCLGAFLKKHRAAKAVTAVILPALSAAFALASARFPECTFSAGCVAWYFAGMAAAFVPAALLRGWFDKKALAGFTPRSEEILAWARADLEHNAARVRERAAQEAGAQEKDSAAFFREMGLGELVKDRAPEKKKYDAEAEKARLDAATERVKKMKLQKAAEEEAWKVYKKAAPACTILWIIPAAILAGIAWDLFFWTVL